VTYLTITAYLLTAFTHNFLAVSHRWCYFRMLYDST